MSFEDKHNDLYVLRVKNKYSQKDMADKLGIAVGTYNYKENGLNEFTLTEAYKLSRIFNITIDELYELLMKY